MTNHSGVVVYFHANDRKKRCDENHHLILSIRATGCSQFFHDKIKLTGHLKFYILRTVIKINLEKNKNHFYF